MIIVDISCRLVDGVAEDHLEKVLILNRDCSILLRVLHSERIRKALQHHASLNEGVEFNGLLTRSVKFAHQQFRKLRRQSVTKSGKRLMEFLRVDISGLVLIKSLEAFFPLLNVVIQLLELLYVDGARAISIEHRDHQATRLFIKGAPVGIDESGLELSCANLAGAVLVNGHEHLLHLGVHRGPAVGVLVVRHGGF